MPDERRAALEEIASEVRDCTRCRLAETRTRAVPGEGDPDTEVVFVGEGPGFNEDREGRPFIGRAGAFLGTLLGSVGWQREDVFITNVVKCRPPDNRDPLPDEIAACAPHLERQLAVLDPAVVVTLGRFSMNTFIPGARIGQVHGSVHAVDPSTGAANALAFAMYHPAAALRSTGVQRESLEDMRSLPAVLLRARAMREQAQTQAGPGAPASVVEAPRARPTEPAESRTPPQPTMAPTAGPAQPGDAVTSTPPDRADSTHAIAAEQPVDDASQLTLF